MPTFFTLENLLVPREWKNVQTTLYIYKYYTSIQYVVLFTTIKLPNPSNRLHQQLCSYKLLLMVQKSCTDMVNIPLLTGFYTSQVVKDFSHQQISPQFLFILKFQRVGSSWWQGWIAGIQGRDLLGHGIRGVADAHHLKDKQRGGRCGSAYLFCWVYISIYIYI